MKERNNFCPWLYVPSYKLVLKGSIVQKIWETVICFRSWTFTVILSLKLAIHSWWEWPITQCLVGNILWLGRHFPHKTKTYRHPGKCTDEMANSWTRWFQHTSLGRGAWALNSAYLCRDLFWYGQSLVWPDAHQLYCHLVALHCRCHQRQVGMLRRLGHVRCPSNDSDKGWVGRKQVLSLYFDYKQDKTKRFYMMIHLNWVVGILFYFFTQSTALSVCNDSNKGCVHSSKSDHKLILNQSFDCTHTLHPVC